MTFSKVTMLPVCAALAAVDSGSVQEAVSTTESLMDGLRSVFQEALVLLVFLATFSLVRHMMKSRKDDATLDQVKGKQVKRKHSTAETAETIIELCTDQFTRGLRLYRDLVRNDLDKELTDESFYVSLVEASVRVNKPDVAEQVVARMHTNGMCPSPDFVQSVLKLLAARKLFAEVLRVYAVFSPNLAPHQVILSCVAVAACETGDMSLARGSLEVARSHFKIPSREWLALMRRHVREHDWEAAVSDMQQLMSTGMPIDNIVFNTVLSACCTSEKALPAMQKLLADTVVYEEAHRPEAATSTVDIVSYNTMLKALARHGDVEACFSLLEQFTTRGIQPDDVSFSTLLDVCIDEDEHQLASVALERMSAAGVQMNCIVMTTLMKGFVRSNRLDKAMQLYDSMRAQSSTVKPDMITHSMLIKAHCDAHDMGTALKVLEDMLESDCTVDDVVFTHLIEGCCVVSNVRLAEKLFQDMKQASIVPSIYTLNGMVKLYGKCGMSEKAIELVGRMEEDYGLKPTVVVFTCLVSGLIRQKKYKDAWRTFGKMQESLPADLYCTQTMLMGLADGQMWTELLELAQQSLAKYRREDERRPRGTTSRPNTVPECLNYSLNSMLNRSQVPQARELYKQLVEKDIEVTVHGARRRLGLA